MLDARNIYRKVSRSVYDFSPEQQQNIAAIVWLYRDQGERFLNLVERYINQAVSRGAAAGAPLDAFTQALDALASLVEPFAVTERTPDSLAETWKELATLRGTLAADVAAFKAEVATRASDSENAARDNAGLTAARQALRPAAEHCRDLTKAIDLAAKLAGRAIDIAVKDLEARESDVWPGTDITRARKALETARADAVEALHQVRYFVKQADWLQDRFPDAKLRNVEGLVKLVDRKEIQAHDWSLTPGRYVGVAPEEVDGDFDFEEALRSIHIDLKGLNEEAAELAARIAKNFEGLGI